MSLYLYDLWLSTLNKWNKKGLLVAPDLNQLLRKSFSLLSATCYFNRSYCLISSSPLQETNTPPGTSCDFCILLVAQYTSTRQPTEAAVLLLPPDIRKQHWAPDPCSGTKSQPDMTSQAASSEMYKKPALGGFLATWRSVRFVVATREHASTA